MALITADRVRDTSTTTGTGPVTVSGTAPLGFRTFSAVLAVNDTFLGMIAMQNVNEWEVGLYTYSGTNQITRTTILASSNGGSAVNFSAGAMDVMMTNNAERAVLGTDLTVPVIYGGAAAGSSLALQSTSGAGSSDFISFRTGNSGIEGLQIDTNQDVIVKQNQKITDYATTNPTITPNSGSFTSVFCNLNYWRCGKFMFVCGELGITTKGTATPPVTLSVPGGASIAQHGVGTMWDRSTGNVADAMVQFVTGGIILRPNSLGLNDGDAWGFSGGFTLS